jgi:hypothetical protein
LRGIHIREIAFASKRAAEWFGAIIDVGVIEPASLCLSGFQKNKADRPTLETATSLLSRALATEVSLADI